MKSFERIIDIKDGVKFKLETKKVGNETCTYGTVIYSDEESIPFKHVVSSSKNYSSYYVWTNENIYIRSHLGTISNYIFDIDKRKQKKIYISSTDRRYAFGITHTGDNRSITFNKKEIINNDTILLLDTYWNGSDMCERATVCYSDNTLINLKPITLYTSSDYEKTGNYSWDGKYFYIYSNKDENDFELLYVYDFKQRKYIEINSEYDKDYIIELNNKYVLSLKNNDKGTK